MIDRCAVFLLALAASLFCSASGLPSGRESTAEVGENEADFEIWYSGYDVKALEVNYNEVSATWDFQTNITDHNEAVMIATSGVTANFTKTMTAEMKKRFDGVVFADEKNKRLFSKLSKVGDAALSPEKFKTLSELKAKMEGLYSLAQVCSDRTKSIADCPEDKKMNLEPGITERLDKSRDYDELLYLWTAWRDASGKKMREDYKIYIDLKNEAAVANGYHDSAEAWRAPYVEPAFNYTDANFLSEISDIWKQLRPLYEQLHAYVRGKLVVKYGANKVKPTGPIPAHLLGNMWAQSWLGLLDFTVPFQSKPPLDVTAEMVKQGYNATRMFRTSDKFFEDLGLTKMPESFWNGSMIVKPEGRDVTCHASAWDFYNGKDFRIKQCTAVNMQDLFTVHHEMGHIEYFLQYKDQPIAFRDGANDGFHEAIGDTLALSVSTPKHLQKLGLLSGYNASDTELDLNFMFSTALEKIAFLPFGLTMDMYRYDIFNGKIAKSDMNAKWWEYVNKYQGVCAPVTRSENDFDPGAKYHVPADVPYMRYFVSFIIQFQFHEAMCNASGNTGKLYQCDIDGSKQAGSLMSDALKLGSSQPWQTAMMKFTNQTKMDARPLMAFFAPLLDFLKVENAKMGSVAGWTDDVHCPASGGAPTAWPSFLTITAFTLMMLFFSKL